MHSPRPLPQMPLAAGTRPPLAATKTLAVVPARALVVGPGRSYHSPRLNPSREAGMLRRSRLPLPPDKGARARVALTSRVRHLKR